MCGNAKLWGITNFELMKNTLPSTLFPILFPINKLRNAITTAKRVIIKEKIDIQMIGQSSTTPFMQE